MFVKSKQLVFLMAKGIINIEKISFSMRGFSVPVFYWIIFSMKNKVLRSKKVNWL